MELEKLVQELEESIARIDVNTDIDKFTRLEGSAIGLLHAVDALTDRIAGEIAEAEII